LWGGSANSSEDEDGGAWARVERGQPHQLAHMIMKAVEAQRKEE
jgi:hypothetical protein